ncbi:hypothetical protein BJY52DRAFT_1212720 [Lactarius psammicola]|nr:hypothetical protein BJY52DRAFT_1212720 [Lactarius psammicola]
MAGRSSISMNVLENVEESPVGTGAHGLLSTNRRSWPTTPDPAPIPQYPSSTSQDDSIYMKSLRDYTNYPSDYYHLPRHGLSDDPQSCYADIGGTNATTGFPDVEDSSPNPPSDRQDHMDEVGLFASGPLRLGPAFEGRDPSPIEGSALPPVSPYFESTLLASVWTGPYSSESGDHEEFPATTAIHGSTQDSSTATTSLGNMATSSNQPHLPDSTSNNRSPHTTHDEAARQLATTTGLSASKHQELLVPLLSPYKAWLLPEARLDKTYEGRAFAVEFLPLLKIHPEQVLEAAPPTTL